MDRSSNSIALLICIYCLMHYCNGVNYGENCTTGNTCATNRHLNCSITNKCVCDTDYSENSAGNGCVADELGLNCNTNVGCADTAAICTDDICACDTTTHYDSNGGASAGNCILRIALGVECTEPSSINLLASDLCSDPNSECRQESSFSPYKCLCKTGFSNTDGQCVQSVNGGWAAWGEWTTCDASCGDGSKTRTRNCTNPEPQNGGSNCPDSTTDTQPCILQACPIDGVWSEWSAWSSCSVTCGDGSQSRNRSCTNPAPEHDGRDCTGDSTESQTCNNQSCPTDGGWSAWSAWSSCSLTCAGGTQTRNRSCNKPTPANGGTYCTDTNTDSQDCNTELCPEKDLGVSCTENTDSCSDANAVCNGNCVCRTGYYDSTGTGDTGGVCTPKKDLGVSCTENTDSCSDANAVCNGNCVCRTGYYDSTGTGDTGGVCTPKVLLEAECPNPNTGVSSTAPCTNTHATCQQDGSTYRCRCTSDYYDTNGNNNNGGQCAKKKLLGATCPTPNNPVPDTESCSDTNAKCKWSSGSPKCLCRDGYYDNDGTSNIGGTCTLKVQLDNTCPKPTSAVPATVTCADSVATCVGDDSNGYKCKCPSDYYDNNGNTADGECKQKVQLDNTCPKPTSAVPATVTCADSVATCVGDDSNGYKCKCPSDYYDNNGNTAGGECKQKKLLGATCPTPNNLVPDTESCSDTNAKCKWNNGYKCLCRDGYYDNDGTSNIGGTCTLKITNGEDCDGTTTDECSDPNAECRGSKCTCKLSYYDDNRLIQGGKCQPISELQVGSIGFSEIKTTAFTVSWSLPSGGLSNYVDHYSVHWSQTNTVNTKKSLSQASSTTSYVVNNGITPGKAYNVMIISHNTQTENGVDRNTSVTTQQAAKPNMVGSISSTDNDLDVSDGNLNIVFTAASNGKSGYIVKLLDGTTKIAEETTSTTSATIQNNEVDSDHRPLKNGYRYNVKIITKSETYYNNGNKEVQSDVFKKVIKTVARKPDSPESVSCGKVTDSSITVSWSPPTTPNGDIVRYHIKIYLGNNLISTRNTPGDETELIVDGLEPGTSYQFKLVTENEVDNSTATSYIQSGCKTRAKMSEKPQNIQISNVESRSFTVTWDKPGKLYSEENYGYVLQIKNDSDVCVTEILYKCSDCNSGNFQFSALTDMCTGITKNTEQKTKAELDMTMTYNASLNPDIEYKVSVTAINSAGRGHPAIETQKTLEEVPQKPTSVSITDLTSTSFTVSWSIEEPRPGKTTFNVKVIADAPAISMTKSVSGFNNTSIEVTGLEEFWNYVVKVIASTSVGSMASDTKNATTDSAAPGQVSEFIITEHPDGNYTQMKVSWKAPTALERNSMIKEYTFEHNATESNSAETFSQTDSENYVYEKTLSVTPETFYRFKVIAINTDNATGKPYEKIVMAPPGKPINIETSMNVDIIPKSQVSKVEQTKLTVNFYREFFEQLLNGAIKDDGLITCKGVCGLGDMLLSEFQKYNTWKTAEQGRYRTTRPNWLAELPQNRRKRSVANQEYTVGVEDCTNVPDDDFCNGPLEPDTTYFLVAVTCTNGGCTLSKDYGPFVTAAVPPDPAPLWIIGVVAAVVIAAVVAVVIVIFIRRRRGPKQMDPVSNGKGDIPELDPALAGIPRKRPICLEEMEDYVQNMHKDSNLLFAKEYEDLKALSPKHSCEAADREENRLKNRYINIIPFDSTRVKLTCMDEDDTSDYINANYLPGYRFKREYIGCQGPIPGTIDDFWRMIWEQNVAIVVMLTLCKEGQKIKCEQYWPDVIGEPKQYGDVVVEVTTCSTIRTYDYRTFKMTRGNTTRIMKHFHFLSWLDFQANVSHDTILDFIDQVRSHVQPPDTSGPIIVHCSAGVGRTGTYICLDHLTQLIRDSDFNIDIDIFDMVMSLRNNRQHMVQTEQQYIFIHDCVLEIMERKRKACNIYENTGFSNDEENIYQNDEMNMYANVSVQNEQKTVL